MDNWGYFCLPHRLIYTQFFNSFSIYWNVLNNLEEGYFYTDILEFTQKIKIRILNWLRYYQSFWEWGRRSYDLLMILLPNCIFSLHCLLAIYSRRLTWICLFSFRLQILSSSGVIMRPDLNLSSLHSLNSASGSKPSMICTD